jgi:DNA-binding GntR family transcriptional regulator
MSLVEYDDLFNVRLLVETQALRLAQGRFFRDKHEEVLRIIDSMEDALQRGDVAAGLAHHKHAHLTIYALAGSPALLQVIDNLWDQCDRNVHTSMAASADAGLAAAEHRELADLLARNELDASLAALQSHLEMTRLAFRHRELAERTGADDGDAASPSIGYRSERATG